MNKFFCYDLVVDVLVFLLCCSFLIGVVVIGGFMMVFVYVVVLLFGQLFDVVFVSGGYDFNLWVYIVLDGIIMVNVICVEMGQYVGIVLVCIFVDELEVDWLQVCIEYVDSDLKWGMMVIGGSWLVWQSFLQFSQVGVVVCIVLIEEGVCLFGVKFVVCIVCDSVVYVGSCLVSYVKIVQVGKFLCMFLVDELKVMLIKLLVECCLVGVDIVVFDVFGKINGCVVYGIDVEVEGMFYGVLKIFFICNGFKVVLVDDSVVKLVKGYLCLIMLQDLFNIVLGWVVVLVDFIWVVMQVVVKVKVIWQNDDIVSVLDKELEDEFNCFIVDFKVGFIVVDDDGVDVVFVNVVLVLEQCYIMVVVSYFQFELVNVLVLEKDGSWEIYIGNQWQLLILFMLVKVLGVDEKQVVMCIYLFGGGFGCWFNGDYVVLVVLVVKVVGKLVKFILICVDDLCFDFFCLFLVQCLCMVFDKGGNVVVMQYDVVVGWLIKVMVLVFMFKGKNGELYDLFFIFGVDYWYNVGKYCVCVLFNDLVNCVFCFGWLCLVGLGWINWVLESFMDEVVYKVGVDLV